jgi:signal transduction histidine kinase
MKPWTLSAKLTAWSTLVVALPLIICGIGAGFFMQHEQIEFLDDQLRNEAHTFFGEVDRSKGMLDWTQRRSVKEILPLTRTERFVEVVEADGRTLYRSKEPLKARLTGYPPGMYTLKLGKDDVRLGVFESNGLRLYLGAELNEIKADTSELLLGFLLGVPLLMTMIGGGGWWVARKALAPVRDITAAAEQITAQRLNRRLLVPPAPDEIARLAEVLNAMFNRLDHAFRQAMRFSADASHELKTPLTVLRMGIEELLESPELSEAEQRAVAGLLEQTHRLSSITESLLLLSRADAGRLVLDLEEKDICETISACVEDARIMAEGKGIGIEMVLPDRLVATVDPGRLSQILLNLLDNAVKYNREGGVVRVSAKATPGTVLVEIGNTGCSIPPERVPQLFDRFFRSDPRSDTPGCGLGLSLARELARAHHGDVHLVSSDPDWTVFVLQLSAGQSPQQLVREAEEANVR